VKKAESRKQKAEGRKQAAFRSLLPSRFLPTARCLLPSDGFSLVELVITVGVMAILTLGVIPLVQVSVKRQKEQQLRESLRQIREAIDQFHREALAGVQFQVNQQQGQGGQGQGGQGQGGQGQGGQGGILGDPRVRVMITDQTIFTVDNADRYPPDLETLVKGVDVLPLAAAGGMGRRGNQNFTATEAATADSPIPKTKIYLRQIPIDPMTGNADWVLRSCYDPAESTSSGGENVFDVHSKSDGKALNGEKYSDW
jgi:general secretion pathway protein G